MKLRKKLIGLGSFALATALFLSPTYAQNKTVRTLPEDSGIEHHINRPEIKVKPGTLAGQRAEIIVDFNYKYFKSKSLKSVVFYEDGKKVAEVEEVDYDYKVDPENERTWGDVVIREHVDNISVRRIDLQPYTNKSVEFIIKHHESGKHTYFTEFIFEGFKKREESDNEIKKSNPITVDFSGKILDLPPKVEIELKGFCLNIKLEDYGDNLSNWDEGGDYKKIKSFKIYEDGKILPENGDIDLMRVSGFDRIYVLINLRDLERTGKHKYFGEITDAGGNTVRTETLTINYD
ncbi:MAG: hypothetical protein ISS23_00675 [Nanoarchaeota archaeon]|nr:hypothetical protein [Nanoarchaeota archaeon]